MDHTQAYDTHQSGTWAEGRYTDAASSQNGIDAMVYKISQEGVYEGVFAMNSATFDGVYDGTGINGKYGGWAYVSGIDDFASGTELAGETAVMLRVSAMPCTGRTRSRASSPRFRRHRLVPRQHYHPHDRRLASDAWQPQGRTG